MAEIRNADWAGLSTPMIKASPHGGGPYGPNVPMRNAPAENDPFGLRR